MPAGKLVRNLAPRWLGVSLLMTCLMSPLTVVGQDISALKAAYIFYFSKFVTWEKPQERIVVCVRSDDQDLITQINSLEGKTAGNKPLQIQLYTSDTPLQQCDVFYSQAPMEGISEYPAGTLTVNDQMYASTVIAFVVRDGKLSFNINAARAREYQLRISSRLLQLAGEVQQ